MMTPLGLPIAPTAEAAVMGWHGPVASSMDEVQAVTVDLGKETKLDEIRLVPAWRSQMAWDSYYGFPARFKLETALRPDFTDAVMVYDRTASSLIITRAESAVFRGCGQTCEVCQDDGHPFAQPHR